MDPGRGTGANGSTVLPDRDLPFVGRETALGALLSAVQAAELGEHVVALVAGEPGVGKTRLVKEAVVRAGSCALWSAAWEGEGAPAYWLWLQLLRALREVDGPEQPAEDPFVAPVAALLDGPRSPEAGSEARFRLFDAVTEALARASRHRPLVLVLEDLHWADDASVRLLEFLATDRRPRRLAVLGTYRSTDLEPSHVLSRRLGDLARDGLHLSLGGLGRRDVEVLLGRIGGPDLADRVPLLHRRSGGNPFFLRELVRLLHDEGDLDASSDAVPAGIGHVVARRVGRLSPATQDVLTTAAAAGQEVHPQVLATATGRGADAVLAALDEARTAGLVVETGAGAVGFVHALVREALYAGLPLSGRAALHRALAGALQEHYGDTRLPEVAHHALRRAAAGDGEGAVDVVLRVAEQSAARHAHDDAAAWFGHAVDLVASGHDCPLGHGELLLRRGDAAVAAGDLPTARAAFRQAAELTRATGDAEQLARAALGLGTGLGGFEVQLHDPGQVDLLEEALALLDPRPSALRACVLARLSVALSFTGAEARRTTLSEQATAVARQVGDPSVLAYALAAHCDVVSGPDHCEARLAEATEVVALAQQAGDPRLELLGRRLRLVTLLETGDVEAADVEIAAFAQVAARLRQPLYGWYVPLWRGMRALMQGRLDEAARQCELAEQLGSQAHSDNARLLTFTQWWVRRRCEGRFGEAATAMAALLEPGTDGPGPTAAGWPYHAVVELQLGRPDRARAALEQWAAAGLGHRVRDSEWLPESAQLAETAVLVGCRPAAELLYDQLLPLAHRFCVEGIGAAVTGSVAWYLALLARFLGDADAADAHARQAQAAHRRVGLVGDPPPLADAGPPRPEPTREQEPAAAMVWEGATWAVTWAGTTRHLRDSKGVRDVAVLLARPGEEVHCLELVGGADVGGDAGPVLDQQARRAYERRISELQADVDEARQDHDLGRVERAEQELDALVQQLAQAFGLSGRARSTGSATERARSAVGWRIRAALRQVAEVHPVLGRHLQHAIRTGTWCSYQPEAAVRWEVGRAQGRRA